MTEAEIKAIVDKLAGIARVLYDADSDDKAEIFRQLGLRLTYHPGRQLVQAEVEVPSIGKRQCPRTGCTK
jgi:site-specific DNA recombinase